MNQTLRKQLIGRAVLGIPIGIAIGYLITVLESLLMGSGTYSAVSPELTAAMGSEMNAVLLQTLLEAVLGAAAGGASVIWQIEDWSLLKQSLAYFVILAAAMIFCAWFGYWMDHTAASLIRYVIIFAAVFLILWTIFYISGRRNVSRMNAHLQADRKK